jgi:E3 ubiquitin-protein ligase RNF5
MNDNRNNLQNNDKEVNNNENKQQNSNDHKQSNSSYECSICLDVAKEPVVTKCGHLFCWPCIYSWHQQKNKCPNCNNVIGKNDFIPIYNKDQNINNTNRFKIPERPKAERNPNEEGSSNQNNFSNVNFGMGFFGFPFFGFQFNLGNNQNNQNNQNIPNHQNYSAFSNIRISNNENINKAARHLLSLLIMMLFYYLLTD